MPTFRAWVRDVTQMVQDPELIKRCGGALYEVWVFVASSATFICSGTPSTEIHFLATVPASSPDDDNEAEALSELMLALDAGTEPVSYMSHSVSYMSHSNALRTTYALSEALGKTYEETEPVNNVDELEERLREVMESLRGNAGAERLVDHHRRVTRRTS